FIISAVFASGYFFGSGGKLLGTVTAKPNLEDGFLKETDDERKELTTQEIAKKVGPSVVGIVSEVEVTDYIWGIKGVSEASGSGIIFRQDGKNYYIITNNHVIDGAEKVSVQVAGDRNFEAEIVGTDASTDLAVIKIKSDDTLTVAKFGDSSKVEVGERAIAIGNPLGMEFFGSITQGIISATNRTVKMSEDLTMNYIQTDAAINTGNSGGALVNGYGEVIGVNTAKISSSTVEGMGFAIPISEAVIVASDLVNYGYVKGRPVIGITTVDVTESISQRYGWPVGIWVNSVAEGSGAHFGGVLRGDIIVEANGKKVTSTNELNNIKNTFKPGDTLKIRVYREGKGKIDLSVRLTEDNPLNSK
ncbi:MAG: trypsin-like peptidase domain-containing protein, partial [Clostridia bacterium]|nr:trypsin-like peptidase domain-containing protein [Clostridia bacterium]